MSSSNFQYEMTIFLDLQSARVEDAGNAPPAADSAGAANADEKAAHRQLHNLGYANAESLEDRIRSFQQDCGKEPTGKLADAQDELNQRYAACDPPARAPSAG